MTGFHKFSKFHASKPPNCPSNSPQLSPYSPHSPLITLFATKRIRCRCWIQHESPLLGWLSRKVFFQVSSTIVHVTFDNIEVKEGWLKEEKNMFRDERQKGMYKYVQEFRLLFTSFLSINIIIFVHTFVKMTRYLHVGCCGWCCVFHYTQWLVSSSTHLPCFFSGKPQNVVSTEEKNEIHENSLVQRSKSDRMWKKHRGMSIVTVN